VRVLRGNILSSLFCIGTIGCYAAIPDCSLDIRSADGTPLSIVGSGIPFQIIVTMHNCTDQPHVELDGNYFASLRRVSVQTRIINGNSTISYIYSARIDRTGTYIIGPADITAHNAHYTTNSCSVEVGSHQKVVGARCFVELSCDDESLYLGQETTLRARVYNAGSAPEVEALHIPKIDGVIVGDMKFTENGTEQRSGTRYQYKEFCAPLSATIIGTIKIPSLSADVRDEQGRRGGFFFFTAISPTKQIYSNTLDLTITQIPHGNKPYALIGDYHSAQASVEPSVVTIGQAIQYRITVLGKGNTPLTKAPLLSDVPQSCKYYDSALTRLSQNEGVVFEYIIQPRQPGIWEIPPQEIFYFDPTKKKGYILRTESTVITAQGDALSSTSDEKKKMNDTTTHTIATVQLQYHPDLSHENPTPYAPWKIPWFWYWVTIAMSIGFGGILFAMHMARSHYAQNHFYYRKKKAFHTARTAINALERTRTGSLHTIFTRLFADLFTIDSALVTESYITTNLVQSGLLSQDGIQSWYRFWHIIVQEQYGSIKNKQIDKTIYTEARLWITAFSKMSL